MKVRIASLLIIPTIILHTTVFARLQVGSSAPDFSLKDEKGTVYSLAALKGKKVALVFYPRPNTPGCTKQVCSLRDKFADLNDAGITVLGISNGSEDTMNGFKATNKLSFPLLQADDNVLKKYGTKGGLTNLYLPKRYTFLVNEQGILVAIIKDVDVDDHAEQIVQGFAKSGQPSSKKAPNAKRSAKKSS